jgi:ATP-dependent Clp protease ATP-binding subunit ClpX
MKARDAYCSFCRKSHLKVGPLVEGPEEVYFCGECVDLCRSIIDQEQRRRHPAREPVTPALLRDKLDQIVSGQGEAKQVLTLTACTRHQGTGRVLLLGPSSSAKVLLARALAFAMEVPFAAGDGTDVIEDPHASGDGLPLFSSLLQAADYDIEAAQHGVVYVDGVERPDTRAALARLWQENTCRAMAGLQLVVGGILFVCGGTFPDLDEASARSDRPPEQFVTAGALTAVRVEPNWAHCLAGIARVAPLDESSLMRLVHWVDFRRVNPAMAENRGPLDA